MTAEATAPRPLPPGVEMLPSGRFRAKLRDGRPGPAQPSPWPSKPSKRTTVSVSPTEVLTVLTVLTVRYSSARKHY